MANSITAIGSVTAIVGGTTLPLSGSVTKVVAGDNAIVNLQSIATSNTTINVGSMATAGT